MPAAQKCPRDEQERRVIFSTPTPLSWTRPLPSSSASGFAATRSRATARRNAAARTRRAKRRVFRPGRRTRMCARSRWRRGRRDRPSRRTTRCASPGRARRRQRRTPARSATRCSSPTRPPATRTGASYPAWRSSRRRARTSCRAAPTSTPRTTAGAGSTLARPVYPMITSVRRFVMRCCDCRRRSKDRRRRSLFSTSVRGAAARRSRFASTTISSLRAKRCVRGRRALN